MSSETGVSTSSFLRNKHITRGTQHVPGISKVLAIAVCDSYNRMHKSRRKDLEAQRLSLRSGPAIWTEIS